MIIFYTSIAALFSIAGALFTIKAGELNKKFISRTLAVSSGIMISVTFLHILPESFALSASKTSFSFLAAIFLLFLIENFTIINSCSEFVEDCRIHTVSFFAVLALGIHSLLDGFNIGISFGIDRTAGYNILFATILHKFADGITLASIMKHSGDKRKKILLTSVLIALTTPLGTIVSLILNSGFSSMLPAALGITAASFVYISMTEIIPHLHRERDYFSPLMFFAGCSAAFMIHFIGE